MWGRAARAWPRAPTHDVYISWHVWKRFRRAGDLPYRLHRDPVWLNASTAFSSAVSHLSFLMLYLVARTSLVSCQYR